VPDTCFWAENVTPWEGGVTLREGGLAGAFFNRPRSEEKPDSEKSPWSPHQWRSVGGGRGDPGPEPKPWRAPWRADGLQERGRGGARHIPPTANPLLPPVAPVGGPPDRHPRGGSRTSPPRCSAAAPTPSTSPSPAPPPRPLKAPSGKGGAPHPGAPAPQCQLAPPRRQRAWLAAPLHSPPPLQIGIDTPAGVVCRERNPHHCSHPPPPLPREHAPRPHTARKERCCIATMNTTTLISFYV